MELKIVQLRKKQGVTQKQLAELCSTTQQQIAKIENGNVDPQLSTLKRVSDALKCEVKDLFYSKSEFLSEIRAVAIGAQLNLRKTLILELNALCNRLKGIPALHPYWSLVEIKNNKITLKETP